MMTLNMRRYRCCKCNEIFEAAGRSHCTHCGHGKSIRVRKLDKDGAVPFYVKTRKKIHQS